MSNEKMILVPLDPATKSALEVRADENGRAMNREAAAIIKSAVGDRVRAAGDVQASGADGVQE